MHLDWLPPWLFPDSETLGLSLARIALTLVAAWIVQRLGFLLVWRGERWLAKARAHSLDDASVDHGRQRARTLAQTTRHLITTLVGAAAIIHILEVFGWDVKPLLVGASILGAALGFGAQSLVRDVIAGAFILIEDQFAVGDRVEVNGQVALVEDVTLRRTRLRDFQGRLLFVPNGEMKIVVNHSRGWHVAIVDLPLAPNQDPAAISAAAERIAVDVNADEELQPHFQEQMRVLGFDRIGPEGAVLRLAARVNPGASAAIVSRAARGIALARLREAGVRTTPGVDPAIVNVSEAAPGAPPPDGTR